MDFMVSAIKVGNVTAFSRRFMRAEIHLNLSLRVGDRVHIVGPHTNFKQTVEAMEFAREKVKRGKSSQKVWIPVIARVGPGDAVELLERAEEPAPRMLIRPDPSAAGE